MRSDGAGSDNEGARCAELHRYRVLDTPPEVTFDRLARIASQSFRVPIALISLVDTDRQWFKARVGLEACATSRDVSFCSHAVAASRLLVVEDARADPRFADNPLVTGPPGIRFYAGMPLITPAGFALGTICVIDTAPRPPLTSAEVGLLRDLAAAIMDQLEAHRSAIARRASQERFERIADVSADGIVCIDDRGLISFWNPAAERMFGFTAEEALGRPLTLIMPPSMRGAHAEGFERAVRLGRLKRVAAPIEMPALHRDGTEFPVELSISAWREGPRRRFAGIVRDISQRKADEERLHHLAHHDPLTGLPNRTLLRKALEAARARLGEDGLVALLLVDVDQFKDVNDTLGHSLGDALLTAIAGRLRGCVRGSDTIARLGGDEFALLLPGLPDPDAAARIGGEVTQCLREPFEVGGHLVHVAGSIGIVIEELGKATVDGLLASADLAMYQAKRENRGGFRFFAANLREEVDRRRQLERELRRAVDDGQFVLHYQPQISLADGRLVGVEALLRWQHPEHGLLSPASFLAVLESTTLARTIGEWVIREGCRQARIWSGGEVGPLRMGVNLSASLFRSGDLPAVVRRSLLDTGLAPELLELEVTENILLRYDETGVAPLQGLHDQGVGIAFDDFGTGYASLSYLKRFPLRRIKIDRQFVRDLEHDRDDAAIVRALIGLGKSLGLEVIAEGVENVFQETFLRAHTCDEGQGFLYGRPMAPADLERWAAGMRPPSATALITPAGLGRAGGNGSAALPTSLDLAPAL